MPKKKLENGDLVNKYVKHLQDNKQVSEGTIKTYTSFFPSPQTVGAFNRLSSIYRGVSKNRASLSWGVAVHHPPLVKHNTKPILHTILSLYSPQH